MLPELNDQVRDEMLERTALLLCCAFGDSQLPVTLDPDDFADEVHADVFRAVRTGHEQNGGCTFPDLCLHLSTRPWFEHKGGSAFLARLMTIGPPETYWPAPEEAVAHALREMRIRRYARQFAVSITAARDMIAQFTRHAEKMASILPHPHRTTLDVLDAMGDVPTPWLPTGFPTLDGYVNMRRGNLVTVGARTGQGKTAFLCNLACNHARAGGKVAFLTKEMTEDEIVPRLLVYLERRPVALAKKSVDRSVLGRVLVHRVRSVEDVERHASLTEADLVIVDYIQILESGGNGYENRVNELEDVTGRLKSIAMDSDRCLIAASQINRETDKVGREPGLADLRGSGSIEQDSNIVILIHNPTAAASESKPAAGGRNVRQDVVRTAKALEGRADMATFIVAKNRSGKTGRCELRWKPEFCAFVDEGVPLIGHGPPA